MFFVAADWRNVEGRLTAHFSRDAGYQRALDGELQGGPKVHAINAGIVYGIDPKDAYTHTVQLSGQPHKAYDGGKRLTHAWSYGMQVRKMASTYMISIDEALAIDARLSAAYPRLVRWRNQLVMDVLGMWEWDPVKERNICTKEGRRILINPFGWQLHFLGINCDQANEVIAFMPQSTGAGMFTRCAVELEPHFPIYTGTYDSFALAVPKNKVPEAAEVLTRVMEQPWPELDNRTFPIEIEVGYNWDVVRPTNPHGLQEYAA